jgi:hypothetical protein
VPTIPFSNLQHKQRKNKKSVGTEGNTKLQVSRFPAHNWAESSLRFCPGLLVCRWSQLARKVPSVMTGEECRNISCVVLTVAPFDWSSVAKLRRNVCQPITFPIPASSAAGRICLVSRVFAQYGFRPPLLGLAKTQSLGFAYRVASFHSAKAADSCTVMGRGRFDPTVFVLPTT